jgi:hypothetical protein
MARGIVKEVTIFAEETRGKPRNEKSPRMKHPRA